MENHLNDRLITELQNDFNGEDLPEVAACAKKVVSHLKRSINNNQSPTHVQTLSERQMFVQQIIAYCAISGN